MPVYLPKWGQLSVATCCSLSSWGAHLTCTCIARSSAPVSFHYSHFLSFSWSFCLWDADRHWPLTAYLSAAKFSVSSVHMNTSADWQLFSSAKWLNWLGGITSADQSKNKANQNTENAVEREYAGFNKGLSRSGSNLLIIGLRLTTLNQFHSYKIGVCFTVICIFYNWLTFFIP